jgi:hypothetical protein
MALMPKRGKATPMGVREFAAWIGCSPAAVRRAARDGRLSASIEWNEDGHLVIRDANLAEQEWEALTRPYVTYRSTRYQ